MFYILVSLNNKKGNFFVFIAQTQTDRHMTANVGALCWLLFKLLLVCGSTDTEVSLNHYSFG